MDPNRGWGNLVLSTQNSPLFMFLLLRAYTRSMLLVIIDDVIVLYFYSCIKWNIEGKKALHMKK